jgi:D-aminopeptidase
MAFATGLREKRGTPPTVPPVTGRDLDPLFEAVVDATEESVLNSMLMAPTVVGRKGNTVYGLDADVVRDLLRSFPVFDVATDDRPITQEVVNAHRDND